MNERQYTTRVKYIITMLILFAAAGFLLAACRRGGQDANATQLDQEHWAINEHEYIPAEDSLLDPTDRRLMVRTSNRHTPIIHQAAAAMNAAWRARNEPQAFRLKTSRERHTSGKCGKIVTFVNKIGSVK